MLDAESHAPVPGTLRATRSLSGPFGAALGPRGLTIRLRWPPDRIRRSRSVRSVRIQVAVAIQGEAHRGVPGRAATSFGLAPVARSAAEIASLAALHRAAQRTPAPRANPAPVGWMRTAPRSRSPCRSATCCSAGEPGAGKSNLLQLLVAVGALDPLVRLTLFDPKLVELASRPLGSTATPSCIENSMAPPDADSLVRMGNRTPAWDELQAALVVEPRSPTAPRVDGSGRTVLACPTPSRKRPPNQPGS